MPIPVPTIGRIVLVPIRRLASSPDGPKFETVIRPGIVVAVWSPTCINARLFSDGNGQSGNDGAQNEWRTSLQYDQDDHRESTWHWMPYQIATATPASSENSAP